MTIAKLTNNMEKLSAKILVERFEWEFFPRVKRTDPSYYKIEKGYFLSRNKEKDLVLISKNDEIIVLINNDQLINLKGDLLIIPFVFCYEYYVIEKPFDIYQKLDKTNFYFCGILNNEMTIEDYIKIDSIFK